MKLNNKEIAFLKSLDSSALKSVLNRYPKNDQTAILTQLLDGTTIAKESSPKISHRESALRHATKASRSIQDIAPLPLPPIGEFAELRRECQSLRRHLLVCYPNAFTLKFSPDHERLIDSIEKAVTVGQLKAIAMPRGSGKTTIILRAALWSLLYGLRKFCVIVAATEAFAAGLLRSIQTELMTNGMLHALYPQETYALRRLEGESRLAAGQRCDGVRTHVAWRQDRLNFGDIEGVTTSGAALSCVGLTGSIRGQQYTTGSGHVVRPDIVLVDDWQTKESAASPTQCRTRYELMMGDVLGMAGPDKSIAALATGTVIFRRDGMERLLDRKTSPQWQGDRCQLVYKWPTNEKIWDEYRTVHEAELLAGGDGTLARDFVEKYRKIMHAGSRVGWEQRKHASEASALQHAYNLRFRDEATFWAEYMNAPLAAAVEQPIELDAEELSHRTNNTPRNVVPIECEKITAFIDVQQRLLYFVVVAWELNGRGHIIDYGTAPDQNRLHFNKSHVTRTLQTVHNTSILAEALGAGLEDLVDTLFGRRYEKQVGGRGEVLMRLDRIGIDARWGYSTSTVRRFCRETKHMGRVHPMMGQYIGSDNRPWHRWTHRVSDLLGVHCKLQAPPKGVRGVAELLVDTNWWKTWVGERLATHRGADKAILLFDAPPHAHRMIGEHFASEPAQLKTGKSGNKVIEWGQPSSGVDNDFWDCLVGASVLASVEGVRVEPKTDREQKAPKKAKANEQKTNRDERVTPLRW
jgi:hypothetical protein